MQSWHEKYLIRWPRRNKELEVIEEEGEDLTQGVLNLMTVHEPPGEEERGQGELEGEKSKENRRSKADEVVILDDNTCPEEVINMVEQVEPQEEDPYPPEQGEFGEVLRENDGSDRATQVLMFHGRPS